MKRITYALMLLIAAGLFVFSACSGVQNLPSDIAGQATALASTAESVGNSVQTILTPPSGETPTPAPTVDLTTLCIPPIGWEVLTDLSLPNNLRVVASRDWVMLTDNDYKMKGAIQATEVKSIPFAEQGVNIEVVLACGSVYFDPDTK